MEITKKDKYISAATPFIIFLSGSIDTWAMLIAPVLLYFTYRRLSFSYAQLTALKIFDLSISLLVLAFALGLANSSLAIVSRDFQVEILLVMSDLLTYIIVFGLLGYYITYLVIFTIFSFRQRVASPYLSFGMFEALRGKRVVAL
ncbi:hypothetical protein [Stutzerimonas balearica]|uniref:hypothetical protein n=1 Tax=Stutzerimonas balearica TaxID=74829 RepID=UPI001909131B|nr:hypothetical protein [Stutzerimonas balearica]MBK3749100.1 hypothetical protein [Stutzerimonas balearica]MBK3827297.1 hypothetical protein [Stutzerimonas balearica]MBK3856987.1 hypothetical protein [Stutzerimonas balearica]